MKIFNVEIEKKDLYELFDSYNTKKQIFDYFKVCNNTKNLNELNLIAKEIGFDFDVYKERRNPSRFCLQCGKKLKKVQKKFCSSSCAAKYNNSKREITEEVKNKISKTLKEYNKQNKREKVLYNYYCECCNEKFFSRRKIKEDRHKYCPKCKKILGKKAIEESTSILDLSKRTMIKILKRCNCECAICGWNESTCDVHHIIPKSEGGNDENDNLILVCPNHHRILHTIKDKYSYEYLKSLSIKEKYSNWKNFYNHKK